MKKTSNAAKFVKRNLHWLIIGGVSLLCALFIIFGHTSENGQYRTLDGNDAQIPEATTKFIEDANDAMWRIMNQNAPTDEETERAHEEEGKGFYTTIDEVLGRRLEDGNNDNGAGWQCSRYTGWLATGQWSYSSAHPDYGPVNGKAVAEWLVKNYGYKYIDTPVKGAIGSGGFNTLYGHTAMYLYSTGEHTAMVNDANFVPLTVSTHNMNIDGWVWVVPGNYSPSPAPSPDPTPAPAPTPEPTPTPEESVTYSYVPGDYFSKVLVNLGLDEGRLWGESGTVEYYTRQLVEQDMLDPNGNVKLYTPFVLRRR